MSSPKKKVKAETRVISCSICDGNGQVCDICGDSENACDCEEPTTYSDCESCSGNGTWEETVK